MKLERFRTVATADLIESLRPGQAGALKTRPDGTVLEGHHRLIALRERGVDVDALPREVLGQEPAMYRPKTMRVKVFWVPGAMAREARYPAAAARRRVARRRDDGME